MVKFLKAGRVVLCLHGRYAGKKAVIISLNDEGTEKRPYPHAIVAGIEKYPLRISRSMDKKRQAKRSTVKPFIKCVNYNHLMPTRHSLDIDTKAITITGDEDVTQRGEIKKAVRTVFEEKYKAGQNKWFFEKLRF